MRRALLRRIVAVAILCLAGSADADESARPGAAPVPRSAPSSATTPQARGEHVLRLALRDAVRMALASNLRLQAGRIDVPIAQEEYRYRSAQFDTLLTAGFEVAHDETPTTSSFFGRDVVSEDTVHASAGLSRRTTTGGEVSFLYVADRLSTDSLFVTVNPSWQQGAVIEARQPILRGAGDRALDDIRRAGNGISVADQAHRALEEEILLEVAVVYWGLAFAQEEVGSRRKSFEVAEELLGDTRARLDAGVGTPLDVSEARAGLEERRGDLIVAENAQRDLSDRLRALVMPFTVEDPRGVLVVATDDSRALDARSDPDPARTDLHARTAIQSRPDVRASLADLANRGIDVVVARDAVRPSLDLTGRVGTGGIAGPFGRSLEDTATGEAVSAAVGLELSLYVGQRAARARCRQAEWGRRQAVLRHRELENRVVGEVRAALRDIEAARARMAAGAAEVAAGTEGLSGERDRLKQARSTPFRVLEREQELAEGRTREARAAADLRIAQARFWKAMGMLGATVAR